MKFVSVIFKIFLHSKRLATKVALEQFSFVVNSIEMCFKISSLGKCAAAKLALMRFQFFMNHFNVLLEIFNVKMFFTDVTLAHCFGGFKTVAKKYVSYHQAI
jgi:hypothetical protein